MFATGELWAIIASISAVFVGILTVIIIRLLNAKKNLV
jgi:hypothetical protein